MLNNFQFNVQIQFTDLNLIWCFRDTKPLPDKNPISKEPKIDSKTPDKKKQNKVSRTTSNKSLKRLSLKSEPETPSDDNKNDLKRGEEPDDAYSGRVLKDSPLRRRLSLSSSSNGSSRSRNYGSSSSEEDDKMYIPELYH